MNVSKPRQLNVIGLNSGTSLDGIDAALFSIHAEFTGESEHPAIQAKLIASTLVPFPPQFQKRLKQLIASGQATLKDICLLNTALGELFARAACELIDSAAGAVESVDLIGSHGQTIWHAPRAASFWGVKTSGSLQLGEPSVIAARTGIPVVADFRPSDVAFNGEGAPLVAFADAVLFGRDKIPTAVLNLGGIANITILDSRGEAVMAFDTGPGNMIIDRATSRLSGCDFDREGQIASSGLVNEALLAHMLSHPYLSLTPPKTTGREDFGVPYADQMIDRALHDKVSDRDVIATATAFSAASIAQAYERFAQPEVKIRRLILGGGGAENKTLIKMLGERWPHPVEICRHEDFGLSAKFKEALLFALLAYTSYFGIANNVPKCTGARRKVCLGKLVRPL